MAGRLKYIILLLATACITVFIIFYGMARNSPRQGRPDENLKSPPIGQNTEQEVVPPPTPVPPQETTPVPQPVPVPEPTSLPEHVPTPKPKPSSRPGKKAAAPKGSIGEYKTFLIDKSSGRIKNIKLAAKKINGHVIEPGGSFSFNGIVGERTSDKGYEPAKVIMDGKYVEDTGGGICQLSSTLYNAAEKAGLQIIERHPHSKKVRYVEEGQDAAVDYGNMDLKFKNTLNCPVEIKAGVNNGEVYAFIIKLKPKTPVSP